MFGGQVDVIKGFIPKDLCSQTIITILAEQGTISLNLPNFETPNVFCDWKPRLDKASPLNDLLLKIFQPMKDKWEELSGMRTEWSDKKLRPQIIHYPEGGGFFGKHSHPLDPQKVGLVLSLTDGEGTTFHLPEGDLRTFREAGDLTLFKYDIPHSVPKVSPEKDLGFMRPTGRFVAILPYY